MALLSLTDSLTRSDPDLLATFYWHCPGLYLCSEAFFALRNSLARDTVLESLQFLYILPENYIILSIIYLPMLFTGS